MFDSKPGDWPYRSVLQLTTLAMLCALAATMASAYWLAAVLTLCAVGLAVNATIRFLRVRRAARP